MDLERLKDIKALVSDVDGVMTDGSITVSSIGEIKTFSVRDGLGIAQFMKLGYRFALLSGRASEPVQARAKELGIAVVKTHRIDKQTAITEISDELGIPLAEMAYIGDDILDLAPIRLAGLGFCPSDAVDEVRAAADHIVPVAGGRGVVRHVIELILKAQGRWPEVVSQFEVTS